MASFKLIQQVQGPGKIVCKTAYFILDAGTSSVMTWNDDPNIWRLILTQNYGYKKNANTATATFSAYLRDYQTGLQNHLWLRYFGTAESTLGGFRSDLSAWNAFETAIAGSNTLSVMLRDKIFVPAQTTLIVSQSGADMSAQTSTVSWLESRDADEIIALI